MDLSLIVAAIALVVALIAVFALRGMRSGIAGAVGELREGQNQLSGRLGLLADVIETRLSSATRQLSDGMTGQAQRTGDTLAQLGERLAVIDAAQKNIAALSEQVVGLQDILSNKQARGAFGEVQLENLVQGCLPPSAYQFQATLGNGKRADCLLKLPNPPGAIVVDAKFPLESYRALRAAKGEAATTQAAREFAASVKKHITDIAEKYIVPGETAESALLFLPAEAVYAELHANFAAVVEAGYRWRVWIVSPTTLMATLNTIRAVLKDARMREQAGLIQVEVRKLLDDVRRVDERVENLATHFGSAQKDVREIQISTAKVLSRGERIEAVEIGDDAAPGELAPGEPATPTIKRGKGIRAADDPHA